MHNIYNTNNIIIKMTIGFQCRIPTNVATDLYTDN